MPLSPLPDALLDGIGVLGFMIYVLAYSLLTFRILDTTRPVYFTLNLFAASCVLMGLSANFNLGSALIQFFWVVMSVTGLVLHRLRSRNTHRHPPGADRVSFTSRRDRGTA